MEGTYKPSPKSLKNHAKMGILYKPSSDSKSSYKFGTFKGTKENKNLTVKRKGDIFDKPTPKKSPFKI